MLKSCFGFPLRTGTSTIAMVNAIASFCYIIFNIWQHYLFRELLKTDDENEWSKNVLGRHGYHYQISSSDQIKIDVLINGITSTFLLAGLTMFFANCELKYATLKNATHKIYLWLLVNYVQSIAIIILEIVILIRNFNVVNGFALFGFFICFIFVDAVITYQLLVVHSFYGEEKSIEQYNYSQFVSKLSPTQIEDQDNEELLQRVELNN